MHMRGLRLCAALLAMVAYSAAIPIGASTSELSPTPGDVNMTEHPAFGPREGLKKWGPRGRAAARWTQDDVVQSLDKHLETPGQEESEAKAINVTALDDAHKPRESCRVLTQADDDDISLRTSTKALPKNLVTNDKGAATKTLFRLCEQWKPNLSWPNQIPSWSKGRPASDTCEDTGLSAHIVSAMESCDIRYVGHRMGTAGCVHIADMPAGSAMLKAFQDQSAEYRENYEKLVEMKRKACPFTCGVCLPPERPCTLHGCYVDLTTDMVCPNRATPAQRISTYGGQWAGMQCQLSCPYQLPGNWRWRPSVERSNGVVTECRPPNDGAVGYGTGMVYRSADWLPCSEAGVGLTTTRKMDANATAKVE